MKSIPLVSLAICVLLPTGVCAEVNPAGLDIPKPTAWVGERLPFFVELRANGSFVGAASFSLPVVPQTVIIKIGSPVVSSEEVDEESWFVQTHEFALFTQQSGTVEIPEIEVRFSHREGFVGPVFDKVAKTEPQTVEILRPAGSPEDVFLITTESLKINETWDHEPGTTKLGAVFHRTISQEAQRMTGMALAPPSLKVPEGIRSYPGQPAVVDQTDRGEFIGKRSDTITYVMRKPGIWTLPAVTYVWWDPERERFGSQTLPEATFQVAAAPQAAGEELHHEERRGAAGWILLLLITGAIAAWRHRWIINSLRSVWQRWNPPERMASRKLLRACRKNDPRAAEAAWSAWRITQSSDFQPDLHLKTAVVDMQRQLFGLNAESSWNGQTMAAAFRSHLADQTTSMAARQTGLPSLNAFRILHQ